MKKLITLLFCIGALFIFSGCAGLRGNIPKSQPIERETVAMPTQLPVSSKVHGQIPFLTESDKAVLVIVGFDLLEDRRPQMDISYMTSIKERVSTEILNAIRSIPLFDEVHFPSLENDSVIIDGEIRKFNWEYHNTMISYIPGLNVLPFFGLIATRTRADVEIYLNFKNKKTNQVVLGIKESFVKNNSYSIYSFNPDKANEELSACFSVVINKIKDEILLNKNKILETVKAESSKNLKQVKENKTVEKTKPAEEVKSTGETKPLEESKPAIETKPQEEAKPSVDSKVTIPQEAVNTEAKQN